jgi:hypothetical protein
MTQSSSASNGPGLWLGLSIAATLLCCLPLGIPGIVYAALAMGAQARGDYSTAEFQTRQARGWTLGAIIAGIAVILIYICLLRSQLG